MELLEETVQGKTWQKASKGFVRCTAYPNDCRATVPIKEIHRMGGVVYCPKCYDRWYFQQE